MGAVVTDAIRLEAVTKSFGSHVAVDALSFRMPRGAICGFIGPNGSGKTTTLRLLLDLLRPDRGRIEVLGETALARVRDRIGYLPEERGLYKRMTVRALLEYFGRLKGATREALGPRIDQWLARMELGAWGARKVESLSRGMAQKLQFVAAVVSEPELLVLDEPLSGLDPVNVEVVSEAVRDLRASGTTILLSTHDMAAAERLCDRICMILRGRKVLDGSLDEIRASARQLGLVRPSLHEIFLRIARPEGGRDGGA
jgi:ABC-2 type transport system ATP-binding protein